MKRVLAFITASIMFALSILSSFTVSAEEYTYNQTNPSMQNDIYMEGTNSFGNMLAAEISAKQAEQDENNGYNVFSIEMTGKLADVEFQTLSDAALVVGIYSEDGRQLIATGSKDVTADDTETLIEIETDTMPQYYYIKAYLVNSYTMRPLCTVYECPTYTQEMQEFLAKTVNDFDSDRVLNLDNDPTNNFAVYSDNVIIIPQTGANTVVSADEENGVYVIKNVDENITSLKPGDTFSYEYGDNQVLIVNIKEIIVNGDTVTITGNDNAVEEVFDYVKIDTDTSQTEMTYNTDCLEDDVTFIGLTENVEDILKEDYSLSPITYRSRSGEITGDFLKTSIVLQLGEKKASTDDDKTEKEKEESMQEASGKVNGRFAFSIGGKFSLYISKDSKYAELSLDYGMAINVTFSGKLEKGIFNLPEINFSPTFGIYLGFKPKLVLSASGEVEFATSYTGTIGFRIDNKSGYQSLNKSPSPTAEVKINATVFFGIDLNPRLVIIHEKVAEVSLSSEVGFEIEGKLFELSVSQNASEKHDCNFCVEGTLKLKGSLSFEINFLDSISLKEKLFNFEWKITDWHYSKTFNEFSFDVCPHKSYELLISVREDNAPTEATVTIDGTDYNTDINGQLKLFLNTDTHEIMAYKGTYSSKKLYIPVSNSAGTVNLHLIPAVCSTSNTPSSPAPTGEIKFKQVSVDYRHSAAITTNGDLYMWGDNFYGQLGNGTQTNSFIPIKIMSNVSYVCLSGNTSAAITTNGDLYTWGNNNLGQLGNGTTDSSYIPVKIMSNVSKVSLGNGHGAAITTNGDLYIWGCNDNGQLGDNTITDSYVPMKVMNNVSHVSLGFNNSAAITTTNDLYMWGRFYLDEKHAANIYYPQKSMNDIASVCLGSGNIAAITTNSDLYTWGKNLYGSLGHGVTGDSTLRVKIMSNVTYVSLGGIIGAAIKDGDLYMWGDNYFGQLGNGTTTNSNVPIKITIPKTSTQSIETYVALSAYSLESQNRTVTGLIPNEIYNIYGMKLRTAEKPFDAENLLYISQAITDNSGTLTFEYLPDEECVNPEIFVKAMREFDVSNAQISYAEEKSGTVSLKWDSVVGASGYTVYIVRNGVYIKEADITGTEYAVSGLVPGIQYGFIVQSCVNGEYSLLDKNDMIYITPEKTVLVGDVNGDGKITAADLILVRRYIVHVDDDISSAADMNNDGKVTAADFIILRRLYMSMQT